MAESRRHRLEIPAVPSTDDPAQLKKYIAKLRQLTMDEFNRMSTDLFNFKAEVANSIGYTLQAVSNIDVIATSYGATFSWVLPQQQEVTPTHVRVRIAEFGDAWAEFTYPITSWSTSGLLPGLEYTFQVQLVYRGEVNLSYVSSVRNCPSVPTLVESTSEIRSRSFTTASGIGPPADGGGANTDFPIPDVEGTPGTGGSGTDCHWEWKIQIADADDGTWSDTAHTGTVDGDAGTITIDTTATGLNLLSTRVYRLCIREICDGSPAGDGSYTCGEPFIGDNDWLDDCGGAPVNDSASEAPYSSADLFAIPLGCLPTAEGLLVVDAVSDLEVVRGEALSNLLYSNNEWTFLAKDLTDRSNYWGQIGWVNLPIIAGLDNTDDISISLSYKVDTLFPSNGVVIVDPLLGMGLRVTISLRSDGTNYGFQVTASRETGGSLILQSPLELTVDGQFKEVGFVSNANGDKQLVVDGVVKATDSSGDEIRLDGNEGNLRLYATTEARMNKVYGWNSVVDFTVPTLDGVTTLWEWWNPEDGVSDTGGAVSAWTGQVNSVVLTASGSITTNSVTRNSRNVLDFSNSHMSSANAFTLGTDDVMAFIVVNTEDTGLVYYIGTYTTLPPDGVWGLFRTGSMGMWNRYATGNLGQAIVADSGAKPWRTISGLWDRNVGIDYRVNNSVIATDTFTDSVNYSTARTLYLGRYQGNGTSYDLDGQVADVIILKGASIPASDITKVMDFLNYRWDL